MDEVAHALDEKAKGASATSTKTDDERDRRPERVIACAACHTKISAADAILGPSQVFPNPLGQMKVIFTVRWAESILLVGDGTTDFTWFDGYAWTIVCCAVCRAHLGWQYDAVDGRTPPRFFGLLKTAVVEADDVS